MPRPRGKAAPIRVSSWLAMIGTNSFRASPPPSVLIRVICGKNSEAFGTPDRPFRAGLTTDFTDHADRENDRLPPGLKRLNEATRQDASSTGEKPLRFVSLRVPSWLAMIGPNSFRGSPPPSVAIRVIRG